MDLLQCIDRPAAVPAVPAAPNAGAATRVLAEALAHALGRDDDRPARWRTPAFAVAVDRSRAELGGIGSIWDLPVTPDDGVLPIGFDEAVARIARNPDDVAVAVRRLELGAQHPLPAWPELVRHGLPVRHTDLDTALWFG
jgi:hypothetical protein